jgi:periplasmic divalent cation tolerance protein
VKIFYITLNTADEARQIAHALLEQQYAVCCNWFPITCAYRWEGKILEEPEVVLLVKTQTSYRGRVEHIVQNTASYVNCIAEITPDSINAKFLDWLNAEVPNAPSDS